MAGTGCGWPGSKLAKPGEEQQKRLAYNYCPALAAAGGAKNWLSLPRNLDEPGQDQIAGHAYFSGQSYRIQATQAQPEATKTCTINDMTLIAMLSQESV